MPAFTFEKISPPLRRGPAPPAEKKQRSRLVQLLDRFAEARTRRVLSKAGSEAGDRKKRSE
jgi:hypothetical protein